MTPQTKARLIAAIAFPLIACNVGTARAEAPTVASTASIIVRMGHVSVEIVGQGPPVLLIPGLASPRAVWDGVTPALVRDHTVYRVEVNGFGGSAPGANLSPGILAGIVADLHMLIAQRHLKGAVVIGHSMGGLAALMLARAHPEDVDRLLIVDSLPYFAVLMAPPGVDPTPAMVEPQARMMRDRVVATYGQPLSDATIEAQVRGMALKPDSVTLTRQWARTADPRVSGQAMYEDLTTDLRPDLATIRAPITLVYPINPEGPAREMVDAFYRRQYTAAPHVIFVPVADSAHFVMLDQPAAFAAAVADFLNGDRH